MVKISDNYPELISVKKWRVRSKSDPSKIYLVEKMADGSFRCSCPAYKECWHIKEKKNESPHN